MATNEKEQVQLLAGLLRQRDQFTSQRTSAHSRHAARRMTERDRDIRSAFRNR
ncbi:hypothetical protein [Erwinia psidii]|uniref:hypothetical protein n=1 Tax=Erwinia psidii TaxID=69224 RepID=UPI00226B538B|nr:hypothetical protein [Erwinia psidii]